jgi:hypothetical protein
MLFLLFLLRAIFKKLSITKKWTSIQVINHTQEGVEEGEDQVEVEIIETLVAEAMSLPLLLIYLEDPNRSRRQSK